MGNEPEIREVVRILIARTEDHPEEFETASAKFGWVHDADLLRYGLTIAEAELLKKALYKTRYKAFHDRVMHHLLGDESPEATVKYQATGWYSFGHVDPRAVFGSVRDLSK